MLRLVGGGLLACGVVILGLGGVERLRERVEVLGQLRDSLRWLEEELSFSLAPMPRLLEHLARDGKGAVSAFYEAVLTRLRSDPEGGLRHSWQQAVKETLTVLKDEERTALSALGEILGHYDSRAQCQALRQTADRLEQFYRQAREDRLRLGRIYCALGISGVLLIVIVLM